MKRPSAFNPAIHGARGLFASMVFVFHVVNSGLASFLPAGTFLEEGVLASFKFGVELFFGISGFVIVGALRRAPSVASFLWDRVTRIYPLLWVTVAAITAVSIATGHWLPPLGDCLLNYLSPPPFFPLPQINPAAWSLRYEVAFYLLCGACWYARRRGLRAWLPLAIVAGAGLLVFLPRALLMPAGLLIAAGRLNGAGVTRAARYPAVMLLAFLLAWRAIERTLPTPDIALLTPATMAPSAWLARVPAMLLAGLFGTLALLGIAEERGRLPRLLCTRPLQWLGTISFYLWHPVVMGVAKAFLLRSGLAAAAGPAAQLLFALVSLPVALAVAHVSQAWIEVRLTRALRRIGPQGNRAHAPSTAAHVARAEPVHPHRIVPGTGG